MKKVFTTGQVAKICKVAPRTASKWFDSGKLKGYRIPGSQDRRIPRENLIAFLKEHGMPLGRLEAESQFNVLCVGLSDAIVRRVQDLLTEVATQVRAAPTGYAAAQAIRDLAPKVLVLDFFEVGSQECCAIAADVKTSKTMEPAFVVAVVADDFTDDGRYMKDGLFDRFARGTAGLEDLPAWARAYKEFLESAEDRLWD